MSSTPITIPGDIAAVLNEQLDEHVAICNRLERCLAAHYTIANGDEVDDAGHEINLQQLRILSRIVDTLGKALGRTNEQDEPTPLREGDVADVFANSDAETHARVRELITDATRRGLTLTSYDIDGGGDDLGVDGIPEREWRTAYGV